MAGGQAIAGGLLNAELYDPATGLWTATGNLGAIRRDHTATLLPSGKVLVAGGFNSSGVILSSAELYDPGTGLWTATGNLGTARDGHTATLLPSGKVLVSGGLDNSGIYLSIGPIVRSGDWAVDGDRQPWHGTRRSHGDAVTLRQGSGGGRSE